MTHHPVPELSDMPAFSQGEVPHDFVDYPALKVRPVIKHTSEPVLAAFCHRYDGHLRLTRPTQ